MRNGIRISCKAVMKMCKGSLTDVLGPRPPPHQHTCDQSAASVSRTRAVTAMQTRAEVSDEAPISIFCKVLRQVPLEHRATVVEKRSNIIRTVRKHSTRDIKKDPRTMLDYVFTGIQNQRIILNKRQLT